MGWGQRAMRPWVRQQLQVQLEQAAAKSEREGLGRAMQPWLRRNLQVQLSALERSQQQGPGWSSGGGCVCITLQARATRPCRDQVQTLPPWRMEGPGAGRDLVLYVPQSMTVASPVQPSFDKVALIRPDPPSVPG